MITLTISIRIGDGVYYPVDQALIQEAGSELNAVIFQALLWGCNEYGTFNSFDHFGTLIHGA